MPPEWWSGHDGGDMPKGSLNMPVEPPRRPLMEVSDVEAFLWAKLFEAVPSAFWLDPYLWEPEKRPKPSKEGQFKSRRAINSPNRDSLRHNISKNYEKSFKFLAEQERKEREELSKPSFPNHPRTPTKDLYFEAKKESQKPMFGPGVNITDPNAPKNNVKKEEKVNTSLDECPNCRSKDFTIVDKRQFKDPVTNKMVERLTVECNACGQKPRVTRPL